MIGVIQMNKNIYEKIFRTNIFKDLKYFKKQKIKMILEIIIAILFKNRLQKKNDK